MEHKSIIEESFYCGVARNETFDKTDKTYLTTLDKVVEVEEQLLEKIKSDKILYEKYNEYVRIVGELQCLDIKKQYVSAFKFGVLLGLELANTN
ncbi:MAG: hypothetical protein IJW64_01525 [Clostridia bacterium]|nr:hypothetical protein [Clostridia bacterium]